MLSVKGGVVVVEYLKKKQRRRVSCHLPKAGKAPATRTKTLSFRRQAWIPKGPQRGV